MDRQGKIKEIEDMVSAGEWWQNPASPGLSAVIGYLRKWGAGNITQEDGGLAGSRCGNSSEFSCLPTWAIEDNRLLGDGTERGYHEESVRDV